jgi:hypothetical protein
LVTPGWSITFRIIVVTNDTVFYFLAMHLYFWSNLVEIKKIKYKYHLVLMNLWSKLCQVVWGKENIFKKISGKSSPLMVPF